MYVIHHVHVHVRVGALTGPCSYTRTDKFCP